MIVGVYWGNSCIYLFIYLFQPISKTEIDLAKKPRHCKQRGLCEIFQERVKEKEMAGMKKKDRALEDR